MLLGGSEVLRSWRHHLRVQSQGHHTLDRLEGRGVERGSARRSALKGRERAIVNQTNIGTVSKATYLGGTSERRGGAHMGFSERRYHLELNGTEQNGTERNWLWQNSNHETVSTGLGQTQIEASRLLGN